MAKDPVCGMEVHETGDAIRSVVSGTTYFFCTPRCKARFEEAPRRYLEAADDHGEVARAMASRAVEP